MNIVKGVADLIWRSSSAGQRREYASTSQSGRFALPTQNIIFSEEGDEAILKALWEKFVNAGNEVEKRKSQLVFLKQFLTTYRNWKPLNFGLGLRTEEDALVPPAEYDVTDVIVGCKFSHPADIICVLTEDIPQIARLLSLTDTQVGSLAAITVTSESLMGLDALTVATRSIHNCKVFGYYGGIQKLTALMKVSIVQLKTILSALSTGEMVSNGMVQNARILQMILGLVVSVICNFVHLHSIMEENGVNKSSNIPSATRSDEVLTNSSTNLNSLLPEKILSWHQIAVMSVMEAGGLNWLLEILRLLRRLTMKGQWVDMSLQHLTLKALRSALTCNLRGQNHFRSIGGLEVLLDGLGISYFDSLTMNDSSDNTDTSKNALLSVFDLHILALEVLREAVFGNFNNLQFLCENGRVQKFANSFCSVAFMLQEYKQLRDLFEEDNMNSAGQKPNASVTSRTDVCSSSPCDPSYLQHWKNYVVRLGAVFCNFLLEGNGTECCCTQLNTRIYTITVSVNYTELSVKWFSRVLCTVFPCIKACSDQNEMPKHLRVFAHIMQHKAICAFKKVLSSSPALIDVFRGEGVWDFLFSESFYYFGPTLTETSGHNYCRNEISLMGDQENGDSSYSKRQNLSDVQYIQVDVISFVEFAATLSGISHNLPECTVLVDALEQSASNPVLAGILAKTLLQILLLGVEKTVSSFKTVAAIPRILKVACIQVQESKMPNGLSFSKTTKSDAASSQLNVATDSPEVTFAWDECMEIFMQLFEKFFSVSDDAKISILHNSMSITCMFDLFWQESLRNLMLKSFIELLMIVPASEEDQKALVFLCSKYVETFTHLKERAQNFSDLSIALLIGMRELLQIDKVHYQALFCESECFLHVVSLLNGNHLDAENGEKLALEVIQTLTYLLSQSDSSKGAFRALVGKGYQMMQSLLLDFCQWQPTEALLNALLDMLVDGNFDLQTNFVIKNEDAILLYLNVLQKSSNVMQHRGLSTFLYLLKDSLSNRAKCVRAGMLDLVLNWFSQSSDEDLVEKLSQLIQVIGGHSISGKDIRKIFALLRSEAAGSPRQLSLLLSSMLSMLSEKGPIAFFDLNGVDSGIEIKTPFQMPLNKGFSFTCWLRVEKFPPNGVMSLFSFLTDNGRGCRALLAKDKLVYESINLKRQHVSLNINLVENKWHFFSLVHSIGRPFSGGSQVKCYVDGILISSVKCRYAKINEQVTNCTVGAKVTLPINEEDDSTYSANDSRPFLGQIGPLYLFSDAITSELVQGIWSLGPSYMYCFLDNEMSTNVDNSFSGVVLDTKESLASKIIFGLSAQASNGRTLFNVSSHLDYALDKNPFEATLLVGSQLCSRRMLQQIIYCVGGVSVFFPLLLQSDVYENDPADELKVTAVTPVRKKYYSAEIIKLIVSNLDDNVANQQQMLLLSGISILGFLLQSVPKNQLNLETLSELKHLIRVIICSELLVKDAISHIFLNPRIWVQPVYEVQRELYLFIIQQFDDNPRLLKSLCRLSRVLDIICQFYCNSVDCVLKDLTEEKRDREEVHKIRLLLLSLGEMSLREYIAASDVEALIAFFETCQDVACIEDTLNMILRAVSQEQVLSSFVEQVNAFGGCHIFLNLLLRDFEPIRLLGLQFIGRLLLGPPSGKKGSKFFNISVGKSKSSSGQKKINLHGQPIFSLLSDRLFQFPETDLLCATIFDVLLGGASPKQVLRKHNQFDQLKNSKNNSQFLLPQFLSLIFRFLSGCSDRISRMKIMGDLLELLDSNPSNIEAFMESGWNAWLDSSANFDVIKNHGKNVNISDICEMEMDERHLVRNLYSLVLCHYLLSMKGGWQYLEETVNFLLIQSEQDGLSFPSFVRDLYGDLLHKLLNITSDENIFILQPCRDNIFYLVKLLDEMLISEMNYQLLVPEESSSHPPHRTDFDGLPNFNSLFDALEGDPAKRSGISGGQGQNDINIRRTILDEWWNIYDSVWTVIGELTGKGPSRTLPRSSSFTVPSLSQRARGLVESLNIPAAEMAAAVSGGIGNALTGKPNKTVDKAMVLRGERCSRFVYRMVILYLCKSSLERASRCVQQFISILPFLLSADDEQSKSRLHLFIWALLSVRSRYGPLDGDARYHVISRLLRETIICGKSMLAATINDDDLSDISSNSKEGRIVFNFIQKDRVLGAAHDEVKYVKNVKNDRALQLVELRSRLEENKVTDFIKKLELEDQIQGILTTIRASDDRRRFLFQQSLDEDQQIIADKWIHTFRLLIDERGPWSANPFPNGVVAHWKLDKSEDAWRRRQKLRQNYHFDDKLCQPSVLYRDGALPSNSDGKISVGALYVEKMKQFSLKGIKRIMDDSDPSENYNEADSSHQRVSEIEGSSERQHFEASKDNRETVLREDYPSTSESENREVLMAMPCVLVTPKRKIAGHLAITRTLLHFFGDFLVEGTAGSTVLKSLYSSGNLDPRIPELSGKPLRNNLQKLSSHLDLDTKRPRLSENLYFNKEYGNGKSHKSVKRHRWWNACKINAVHWTRYLLRYTAVEIFFVNSAAPIFLNFASQKVAKDVGNLIVVTRNETMFARGHRDKTGFISFVDRRLAQEMAESSRERWKRREITNFEYLMILNTLSGRSYNDLTQYPVFPWILADYSSETLDLNKSSTYRDLSKPVGALDAKRFEVFEDRYHNFVDPDIPSFYYGSHYSSMGIVLFYLLRLEPFTALHRSLQGGKFDHADRLFQSIEGTYRNCLSNTSDVKELIPEFFYMPEFLMNSNSYHFGVKQDGEPIGDVCLPPWAKGSPEEFISRNREALESEYVSSNLHHWIDLVFGYKQRGKPAAEAANIFYYLTYEGAVNLDNMEDDLQRSAIEDQIANFGQTPIQLFKKKHPRRGPPIPIAHLLQFAPNSINLTSVVAKTSNSDSAVMYINVVDSYIVAVNQNFTMLVKMWLTTQLQSGGNLTFSSSQDLFFGIGSDVLPPCKIGSPLADGFELGSECFETLQTPSDNFLISCGSWENSFQVTSLSNGKIVQSVRHHKDVVSCVAVTADGSILATGSYDTTVMIWEIFRIRDPEKRSRSTRPESSWKDQVISDTPSHILCGHDDIITCLYASAELDLVISGSKDGTCIIHSLQTGRYVRSIQHPGDRPLSKLVISRHGRIVLYSDDLRLHLFSINGRHLATAESSGRLGCIELSRCGEFLICAGEQGHIVVRSMNSLEMITKYPGIGKSITSLTVTPEECFIAGTKDGSLLVYSIENKTGFQRSSKSKTNRT